MPKVKEKSQSYKMIIERTIVDKLGLKLYDKISAVVAELIANSYDADAENVIVSVPLGKALVSKQSDKEGYIIEVSDDGYGMTPDQAQKFFLHVGMDKRKSQGGDLSRNKHRKVMGRKGIGKLAPFGVCKVIEVRSAGGEETDKGYKVAHFSLDYDKIIGQAEKAEKAGQEGSNEYSPNVLNENGSYAKETGTTIRLYSFLPKKVPDKETFARQLGSRFGLNESDFKITVKDNKKESPEKPFIISIQNVPLMKETRIDVSDYPMELPDGKKYVMKGWVGFAKDSYQYEELAGIRIYVRGKIASTTRDFGSPSGFTGEWTARSYLVGEIHADWIDDDEDLIQTSRQDILWGTDLGQIFSEWGKKIVKMVSKAGRQPRREKTKEKFMIISDLQNEAKRRFADPKIEKAAMELGEKIGAFANEEELENDGEYVESLKEIILSVAPHKLLVDTFQEIEKLAENGKIDIKKLIELFKTTQIAQMASLGQVVFEKIKVIDLLEKTIRDPTTTELDLQKILEEAPWLIDHSWQALTMNQALKTFRSAFESWFKKTYNVEIITSTILNEAKRPDFIFLHVGNCLIILEIKCSGHPFNDTDWSRFVKYPEAIEKFCEEQPELFKDFPRGYRYIIISDGINLSKTESLAFKQLEESNQLKHHTWEALLGTTKDIHRAFLEARDKVYDSNAKKGDKIKVGKKADTQLKKKALPK
jgi:hypothetical protein